MRRLVVGISGSTGAVYGVRLLQRLREQAGVEVHLVMSGPAKRTLVEETDYTVKDVEALAHVVHDNRDIGSALATCHTDTLIARAGDVTLKEGRPLVLVARETPLHAGHLKLMLEMAQRGAVILPPMPAFYQRPRTLDEIVDQTVARVLERLGLEQDFVPEWTGESRREAAATRRS
jgi:4-hydroxy-3-polyprenylbenzoate decarboxylase